MGWLRISAKLAAAFCTIPVLAFAKTEVSFLFSYDPEHPEEPATRRIVELARTEPELEPVKWGGLTLPGAGGRATFMLALAGGTAPDIYKAWFHILRHDAEEGFVHPLDEWVEPASTNGTPAAFALWDQVRVKDGRVLALPTPGIAYYGLVYRKDLVAAAGLDPENPPRTWSAFRDWCMRLTRPGRRAFAIENRPWGFLPWVQSAGGDVVRRRADGTWEACFDSPAALRAASFLQDLVRRDVVRGLPTLSLADEIGRLFTAGEIVCVFGGEDLVRRLTETLNMPPETIGLMPFPAADEGGVRVLQAHKHFYAMSESAGRRLKPERDLIFKCLQALASPELADEDVRRNVAEGRGMLVQSGGPRALGVRARTRADSARHPRDVCGFGGGAHKGGHGAVGGLLARRERPCPASVFGSFAVGRREGPGLRRRVAVDNRGREPGIDVRRGFVACGEGASVCAHNLRRAFGLRADSRWACCPAEAGGSQGGDKGRGEATFLLRAMAFSAAGSRFHPRLELLSSFERRNHGFSGLQDCGRVDMDGT